MAKTKKKRMKLPNGFGSIRYLGNGRRKPYAAYPPATELVEYGFKTPQALSYEETWEDAYEVLTVYNMSQKGKIKVQNDVFIDRTPTFEEIYYKYFKEKYESSGKTYSHASKNSTQAAFKNCSTLHNIQFGQLRYNDLQEVINNCKLRHASIELIINLFHQMFKYAMKYEIVEKDYSEFIYIPIPEDDESGVPFTEDELHTLWNNKEDSTVQMLLILCYSGFRISETKDLEINLDEHYFRGGVKTRASKNRIVPIHDAIYDMVVNRYNKTNDLLQIRTVQFRKNMYEVVEQLGMEKHTPHDCRHTFSMLCEKYDVRENDRKRILGHAFDDITNSIYGHRAPEELLQQINKIKVCY